MEKILENISVFSSFLINLMSNQNENNIEKEELEEHPFFHYYGMLSHQQNMLQDNIRTGTYRNAILNNKSDFKNKIVLDVGTGTGILSFFASDAGAKKVYAIEISKMAYYAERLVKSNKKDNIIKVIRGKVEEVEIPEKVDIIISEPMGFFLVHERMLESFIIARKRFLKKGGKMFPSVGHIYLSIFSDQALYDEQFPKSTFWNQTNFYGLDISELYNDSVRENFSQPVIGYFDVNQLVTYDKVIYTIDFEKDEPEDLHTIDIPFSFRVNRPCIIHGIANWFDVIFNGSTNIITLSTAPDSDCINILNNRYSLVSM